MSQFYARYVPPSTKSTEPTPSSSKIEKRKRDADIGQTKSQKRARKTRGSDELLIEETAPDSKPSKKVSKARHANDDGKPAAELENATSERKDHLDEASHTKTNGADRKTVGNDASVLTKSSLKEEKIKKKEKRKSQQLPDADEAEDEAYTRKHDGVLSKFNKALTGRPARSSPDEDEVVEPPEELHGLEPIPQPVVVDKPVEKPSFSVLPQWQSDAVRVVHRETKSFSDLHIAPSTVENLRKNGLDSTFPIQTTVLPLLLEGKDRHRGDVCVSAATGSGKTLAYVLPMVEDLKEYPDVKLRGIIVVPTRELVQQVRQLCEICAAGSKLKIVVASGSKALKDEQNLLVVEEQGYDPQKWEEEQNAPVDWANFSMAKFMQEAQEAQKPSSFHFVKQHRSKADILITTPGRLVDHLRSTPGFNLDHVKWLVVDEADRLLNESYQEWIDVVAPALQSQAATAERDRLLRQMRMEPPRREVRKVLLSATMTRDISKLNSLGLVNPKLVVLGHPQAEIQGSAPDDLLDNGEDGSFHLPPSLTELVVPIKDGYDKPLYLLEILQTRILGNARPKPNAEGEDSSESESDSSSSSSSSDISSDTDSASDPSSASSSESSSGSESDSEANSSTSPKHTPKSTTTPAKTPSPPTTRVLIFTRSTASTLRLSRLLTLLSPSLAPQISTLTKSTSTSASSRRALSSFRSGRTPILIATDRASRGLDIPELQHVISYDVPGSALTYVHRVGRTARAGREGTAWTCVEHREGRWFWGEVGGKGKGKGKIQRVQGSNVQKVEVEVDVEGWKGRYEEALGRLGEEVKGR